MSNTQNFPQELANANEEQYRAYIHKAISRNRMGIAFTDVTEDLENWIEQTLMSVRAHGSGLSELSGSAQLAKLNEIASPALEIDDVPLRLAVLNYSVLWRKDEFRKALQEADLLSPGEPRYRDGTEGKRSSTRTLDKDLKPSQQPLTDLPDLKALSINLRQVTQLVERGELSATDRKAVQELAHLGEWAVLNGPRLQSIIKTERRDPLPTVKELSGWPAEKFFSWFKYEIAATPRKQLIPLVKSWLKRQAGKHEYKDLPPEQAILSKRNFAVCVMEVLDALELKVVCGRDGCGWPSRLGVLQPSDSPRGQFFFGHASEVKGKRARHETSVVFPDLRFSK